MANDIYRTVGAKIRELRKSYKGRELNQDQLAEMLETTPNTISRWETGAYRPSIRDLQRLSQIFGVSIGEFVPSEKAGNEKVNALLSAVSGLNEKDMDELVEYARFRKARHAIQNSHKKKRSADDSG